MNGQSNGVRSQKKLLFDHLDTYVTYKGWDFYNDLKIFKYKNLKEKARNKFTAEYKPMVYYI